MQISYFIYVAKHLFLAMFVSIHGVFLCHKHHVSYFAMNALFVLAVMLIEMYECLGFGGGGSMLSYQLPQTDDAVVFGW